MSKVNSLICYFIQKLKCYVYNINLQNRVLFPFEIKIPDAWLDLFFFNL